MARATGFNRLDANRKNLDKLPEGRHYDSPGLFLVVEDGARFWEFRFTAPNGERAMMRLGHLQEMSLKEARDKRAEYNSLLKGGDDPRSAKTIARGGVSFIEFALEQFPILISGCGADEHAAWKRGLESVQSLHNKMVHLIDSNDVYKALLKIWTETPVTAQRTRQRLERLFNAAKVRKLRTGENPAAWRGNLEGLLPSLKKIHTKVHHKSVPYADLPAAMEALHFDDATSARVVEMAILTALRSQEVRLIRTNWIDWKAATLTIPAAIMKIKKNSDGVAQDHVVPMSHQVVALLRTMPAIRNGERDALVFPSDKPNKIGGVQPFRPNALTEVLSRHEIDSTAHGMRASFRQFAGESVAHNFRREVVEACMAHKVAENSAEEAYWRSATMIERRREVMQAWADFLLPTSKPMQAGKPSLRLVAS